MIPYGLFKRGSKLHPHNERGVCKVSEKTISKKRARREGKKEIKRQLNELPDYDIPGEIDCLFWY